MPDGLEGLPPVSRIRLFIRTLLPLILRENERIAAEWRRWEKMSAKEVLAPDDLLFIRRTARKYRVLENEELSDAALHGEKLREVSEELRIKIRPVDPALAIALAALESGWGTSRFVGEANNLFGHTAIHAWKGIQPLSWQGTERNIKRFETISDSIERFMLNLNRNRAYLRYRIYRELYPGEPLRQTAGFINYSRIGTDYTERLSRVIVKYGISRYSSYQLDDEARTLGVDLPGTAYLY